MNNVITGNSAIHGGGLYLLHSSSIIANNILAGNEACDGGAVYLSSFSYPTIANNTLTRNTAEAGGGMYLSCESAPVIANARNDVAACNAVRAFINALEALSGKHIPEAEAAALVEMAHQTLEFLGCSDKHGRDSDLRWFGRERPGHSR